MGVFRGGGRGKVIGCNGWETEAILPVEFYQMFWSHDVWLKGGSFNIYVGPPSSDYNTIHSPLLVKSSHPSTYLHIITFIPAEEIKDGKLCSVSGVILSGDLLDP